jgi:hypothetical protein
MDCFRGFYSTTESANSGSGFETGHSDRGPGLELKGRLTLSLNALEGLAILMALADAERERAMQSGDIE